MNVPRLTASPVRLAGIVLLALTAISVAHRAAAEGDPQRGAKAFQVCAACHSLRTGLNMTGPSLAGILGRKAGSLTGFDRYSPALKASGVTWDAGTLEPWLRDPAALIPDNWMTFPGVGNSQTRADLIAFLNAVSETSNGATAMAVPEAYTKTPMDLKHPEPDQQVTAIRNCRDSYFVTTADGKTRAFWDQSLRLESDASEFGPLPQKPVTLPSGMFGDRALVVFANPDEISPFIKHQC
jgi:cytochrome c